ncbi:TIGR01457 family HAD-type hydrolase [Brevibacillus fulvus]|uniref:TIGR01457 family HAD-type hydrolase n=1 Tax=Brevibacillus fulvus TaxID=1125967 RepID=UPI00195D21EF|nr:TIGR01457 family HAD-type hydrolase [Brevibacillus fulvus]
MKVYNGFLLDLDGTIYRGTEPIPEALQFIKELRETGRRFLYVTNNSSTTPEKVAVRLEAMGLPTDPEQVYTSSMAVAAYLSEKEPHGADVFIIGEEGLHTALQQSGFRLTAEQPRYVVIGIDRAFTYEKLAIAVRAIRNGAQLIATNKDAALPTENGLAPGTGSLVAAVSVAAGTTPLFIGKPETIIVNYALQRLGTAPEETLIVGDNLFTDIEAGANSGLDSLLVLTGFSTEAEAERHPHRPTYVAANVYDWWKQQREQRS